ncbi:MAG: cell division protein ZapA [Pseudomonadota bacterium]
MSEANAGARVTVRILDKEYQVACPPGEHDALLESARLLNNAMKEIRDTGRIVGLERIAIMAALNLANELREARATQDETIAAVHGRLQSLSDRADRALEDARQMNL